MKLRLLLAFALLLPALALAWMDSGWQYRAPITLNNSGGGLTDYQVLVNTANLIYNNSGLVGSWHFSEGSGTRAADSSGNGNDGTYNGETLYAGTLTNFNFNSASGWAGGKYGNALVFDGSDDFVNVGGIGIGGANTREFWFKPNNVAGNTNQYFMDMGGNSYWVQLYDVDGDGKLEIRAGGASSTYVNGIREFTNTSEWHHVAVTVSAAGLLSIYVDGALDASGGVSVGTPGALYLGRYSGAGPYYLNGVLDNVQIYNRALSAQEILQLYQNNTFLRSGLASYWRLEEGAGTVAQDTHHIATEQNKNSTKSGNALGFDGVNDYVSIPNSPKYAFGTNNFTVDFWIKWEGAPGDTGIMGQSEGGGSRLKWGIVWNALVANSLTYHFQNPAGTTYNVNWGWIPNADTWYHVAIKREGNGWYLFVNGAQTGGTQTQSAASPDVSTALNIGADGELWRYTKGIIDEARIYDRSLSAQEIQARYSASKLRLDYADLRFSQPYTLYETPVSISGTGADLADYQVLVNITNPTTLSHMRPDGSDLRFFGTQTSTPYSQTGLPYWVESINSTLAKIWVKANVSAGGSTIYMYYGNPAAQAVSNGSAAFDFFDDFNGAGLDANKWNAAGAPSVSSGVLTIDGLNEQVYSKSAFNQNVAMRAKAYFNLPGTSSSQWLGFVSGGNPPFAIYEFCIPGNCGTTGFVARNLVSSNVITAITGAENAYKVFDLTWNSSLNQYLVDSALKAAHATNIPASAIPLTIFDNGADANSILVDWILVRKYAASEPAATLGPESVKSAGNEAAAPFWQESDNRVWVKAASVPNGTSTIYAYYGNPGAAGAGSGSATFELFDDFNDGDYGGWTASTGGWSASQGYLRADSVAGVHNIYAASSKAYGIWEFRFRTSGASNSEMFFKMLSAGDGIANNQYAVRVNPISGAYFDIRKDVGGLTTVVDGSWTVDTSWHDIRAARNGTGAFELFLDGQSKGTGTDNSITSTSMLAIFTEGTNNYDFDNIRIRKYASPEPTLSLQQEELQSPALFVGVSPASRTTYPNYNETFTLWVYNNQTFSDTFALSCAGACSVSPASLPLASYQNGSATVAVTSANVSGTTIYAITATSQSNTSNYASVAVSLTVDTTRWRSNWTDAYNREFKYRVPIAISNSGSALADYQVNITIDTSTPMGLNRMRGDCGDLRLTNGTNEMPYWLESGCNTSATKIWAKVPSIPAGSSVIYIYYGNPAATTTSNGTNTLEFFDDFSGDLGRWTTYDGTPAIESGELSLTESTITAKDFTFSNHAATYRYKYMGAGQPPYRRFLYFRWTDAVGGYDVEFWRTSNAEYLYDTPSRNLLGSASLSPDSNWHTLEVRAYGTSINTYVDGVSKISYNSASVASGVMRVSSHDYSHHHFDDVRVRKYSSPEPVALAGAEQTKGYRTLVRRCGLKQAGANVTAYYPPGVVSGNCTADANGICSLEISAGTYDLRFVFPDNTTAWKNGTVFG